MTREDIVTEEGIDACFMSWLWNHARQQYSGAADQSRFMPIERQRAELAARRDHGGGCDEREQAEEQVHDVAAAAVHEAAIEVWQTGGARVLREREQHVGEQSQSRAGRQDAQP